MALRQVILGKRIEEKRAELLKGKNTRDALRKKRSELDEEEKQLEAAVAEVTEETSQEDKDALDQAVEAFEAKAEALEKELEQAEAQVEALEKQLGELENEQKELSERAARAAQQREHRDDRKGEHTMETRTFFGMNAQQRDAFFARSDVKDFLTRLRALKGEKRAVTGEGLLVPTVALEIVREVAREASKLMKHVNTVAVAGKARQVVAGTIPEPVWMEACGKLNELELSFSGVELDGYKVGGYIPVANATLEDSDIDLASEVFDKLGRAIGLGIDMAILYGTGKKMPLGILTRLAQTAKPDDYPDTARTWENLSASNVVVITGKTGAELFKEILLAAGNAKSKYAKGGLFFAMNEKTRMKLVAEALSFNAAGAIVSGVGNTMPVVGGAIETLEFIPDDVIFCGYEGLYLLGERDGTALAVSEHVRFIDDQTVFKGTARYDGVPVIPEGFVVMGIGGSKPVATAVTFRKDVANEAASESKTT